MYKSIIFFLMVLDAFSNNCTLFAGFGLFPYNNSQAKKPIVMNGKNIIANIQNNPEAIDTLKNRDNFIAFAQENTIEFMQKINPQQVKQIMQIFCDHNANSPTTNTPQPLYLELLGTQGGPQTLFNVYAIHLNQLKNQNRTEDAKIIVGAFVSPFLETKYIEALNSQQAVDFYTIVLNHFNSTYQQETKQTTYKQMNETIQNAKIPIENKNYLSNFIHNLAKN